MGNPWVTCARPGLRKKVWRKENVVNIPLGPIHPTTLNQIPTWSRFVDHVDEYHNVTISERAIVVNGVILPIVGCEITMHNVVGSTHTVNVQVELAYGEQAVIKIGLTWVASLKTGYMETRFDVEMDFQVYDVYLAGDKDKTCISHEVENVNDYNETFSAILEEMPNNVVELISMHEVFRGNLDALE